MDKPPTYPMTVAFSEEGQCWIAEAPALDLAADADCPLVALNELLKAIGGFVETHAALSRPPPATLHCH